MSLLYCTSWQPPVTLGNRPRDTGRDWGRSGKTGGHRERLETPGKTADTRKDGKRWFGLAPRTVFQKTATTQRIKSCPRGSSRKGGENDEPIGALRISTTELSIDRESDKLVGYQCVCGKSFKTDKGMKIHRTKMGCFNPFPKQRYVPPIGAGKTSETPSLESNHSAGSSHAEEVGGEEHQIRERIKFPQAGHSTEWATLDDELCKQLKEKVNGSLDNKIKTFGDTIYDFCVAKYGALIGRPSRLSIYREDKERYRT